jgi:hypothetical protein
MWAETQAKWTARTGPIPFHANDCDSDHGNYAGNSHEANKNLYRDLTIILVESNLAGWAFAMDLAARNRVFPNAPPIIYYRCLIEVVQAMRNCAANNRETVRFIFDKRRESEYNTGLLYAMLTEEPEWNKYIFPEISFVSSREEPGLQIADLFSREAMKTWDNRFGPVKRPVRKSWTALRQTGRFHINAVSDEWFIDLKKQLPIIDEVTGVSEAKYVRWLKDNGRQHSITSLFLYMQASDKADKVR